MAPLAIDLSKGPDMDGLHGVLVLTFVAFSDVVLPLCIIGVQGVRKGQTDAARLQKLKGEEHDGLKVLA